MLIDHLGGCANDEMLRHLDEVRRDFRGPGVSAAASG